MQASHSPPVSTSSPLVTHGAHLLRRRTPGLGHLFCDSYCSLLRVGVFVWNLPFAPPSGKVPAQLCVDLTHSLGFTGAHLPVRSLFSEKIHSHISVFSVL